MDLLRLLGFIRDAAGTDMGREVIQKVRSSMRNEAEEGPQGSAAVDISALFEQHRAQVDRDLQTLASIIQRQQLAWSAEVRRQRRWNFALAAGLAVTLVVATLALI